MSKAEEVKLPIKVVVNKEKTKVLTSLDSIHFEVEAYKQNLLNPVSKNGSHELSKLRLNVDCTYPKSSGSEKSYDGVFHSRV